MNSKTKYLNALPLFLVLLLAGCQKPGPIELQDSGGSQISEVEPVPASSIFEHEPDTTGLIAVDRERYFAEFVVAGVRFDAPNDTHTISLARAVFHDTSRPIFIRGRRIGYRTLDAGTLLIDGLPLNKTQRRIRIDLPGISIDTAAGFHYILLSKDGVGGRGFEYLSSHRYEWTNLDSTITINFQAQSAETIRVTRPTPQDVINQRRDLLVEWEGGEETVHLIVSTLQIGRQSRPILRMRLRSERRRVVIPSKVLQMLPVDRSARFVFSFVSQTSSETQVGGFPSKALVHSAFIHNLILTVQR